ncbi:hypothetical protein EMIHUDRAFT_450562 [Emiliania huxleyi CCMP1516]|uniref:ENTH domain-containing protein n=2 Tax=Emiliania huxleyi TaxID=2903 RepID=A0A0D3JMB6_EMIH1|nr:hypothetical protein EMIHUDRAFT_450562 [Emiliania huxleyi CCMP1516]EOD24651.1 hypothetical protein EMIHUDRAFT_450562 [Emiliania huxleyi CCMP1516]|eukprot:XP_005777080.1 hypothetical protein EMIHUDRAFT_450562 [Emiliania huxleyi CCMP1516]
MMLALGSPSGASLQLTTGLLLGFVFPGFLPLGSTLGLGVVGSSPAMDKSLVSKATADSAEPTPGYMFNEIARITHASVDACLQLENFLLKRLKKDSVHVKLKVLRVIKHCCQHGHATFRREMQRHTTDIKECLSACCTAFPPARLAAGDAGALSEDLRPARIAAGAAASALVNARRSTLAESPSVSVPGVDERLPPPAKLDDPEYNAAVLERWREHVRQAREAWQRKDMPAAEAQLKQALEAAGHFGGSSAPMATSLLNMAQFYRRANRQADAEPLLLRAADVLDQTAGPYNKAISSSEDGHTALVPMRPAVLLLAARAQQKMGQEGEAEARPKPCGGASARLRLAVGLLSEQWGPESPRLIVPYDALGKLYRSQLGREAEASDMEERVGSLRRIQADFSSGGGAALRQKLSAGGAVLYGAGKCAETRRQLIEAQGLEGSFKYVDCAANAQVGEFCKSQGVDTHPTWVIHGRRLNGFLPREGLAQACDHLLDHE